MNVLTFDELALQFCLALRYSIKNACHGTTACSAGSLVTAQAVPPPEGAHKIGQVKNVTQLPCCSNLSLSSAGKGAPLLVPALLPVGNRVPRQLKCATTAVRL